MDVQVPPALKVTEVTGVTGVTEAPWTAVSPGCTRTSHLLLPDTNMEDLGTHARVCACVRVCVSGLLPQQTSHRE